MRPRNLAIAALAGMALLGVGVSNAQATAHWNVEGAELSGSETISYSGGSWTLSTTVLGVAVELTAESVACGSTCTISGTGESAGALKFSGVKVVKPTNCTASSPGATAGTIVTKALKDQVIMDPKKESLTVFDKFTPASGTTFMELEFQGAKCSFAELSVPVAGAAGGEFPGGTGSVATEQKLTFGSTQQTTSESALTVSGKSATLTGVAKVALAGAKAGAPWGAMEALWLSKTNVSGAGEAPGGGLGTCEFAALNQKCRIEFKNITARTLAVVSTDLTGTEATARYKRTAEVGCVFNLGMGEFIDQLELVKLAANTVNDYCITVVDKANNVEFNFFCAQLHQ